MLSISHSLTGAFVASQIPVPIIYGPLALIAHYLEDWVPHWDFGTGLSSGKRKKITAVFWEIGELLVSVALIYWFFQKGYSEIRWHIWAGSLIGIVPDLLDAPRNFFKLRLRFLDKIYDFHQYLHHSVFNMFFGLIPQIIIVGLIFWLK